MYHTLAELVPDHLDAQTAIELTSEDASATEPDATRHDAAAAEAAAEIDSHIGTRYALPLATVPAVIVRLSRAITIFRLYERRYPGGVPEGIRTSYTDAVKALQAIGDGTVTLGVQPAPAANAQRAAVAGGHTRIFSRTSLADA